MTITAIQPVAGPGERVRIELAAGRTEEIATEIVVAAGLRVGDHLPEAELRRMLRQDLDWRARDAALRLLAYRPRSEAELRLRLLRQQFPAEVADACLEGLRAKGLLDDASFAESYARDRIRLNPRGARRVVQELRGRGVDAAVAASVVGDVLREEDVDELDLARQAARRWRARAGEEPDRARRRLTGFLARRGFGGETVRRVVEELCPGE